MAQFEDEKDRDPDGDRAGEMRQHGDSIGRRDEAIAEKQRRGP